MDRTVKILLGIAIGVMYPVLTWFIVYTLIQNPPDLPPRAQKSYPVMPRCQSQGGSYEYDSSTKKYTTFREDAYCVEQKRQYERQLKEYKDQENGYNKSYQEASKKRSQVNERRAQLSLAIGIIGILLAAVAAAVPALAAGLAGGATATTLVSTLLISPGLFQSGMSSNSKLSVGLLLAGFVVLSVELWVVDNKMFPKKPLGPTKDYIEPEKTVDAA